MTPQTQHFVPHPKPTRQFAGLVVAPVKPDRLASLKQLLLTIDAQTEQVMRGHLSDDVRLPFHRMQTVHYARFVLVPRAGDMTLVFCTNYDGLLGDETCSENTALTNHIDDLVRHAGTGLTEVFSHCEGNAETDLPGFLRKAQTPAATFYAGASGRSLPQILWESDLRRRVEAILDEGDFRTAPPEVARSAVLGRLNQPVPAFPPQPNKAGRLAILQGSLIFAALLLVGGLAALTSRLLTLSIWASLAVTVAALATVAGAVVLRFRHLEKTDVQFQIQDSPQVVAEFKDVSIHENRFLQNPLSHLAYVKPGPLRWLVIRAVFFVLQFSVTNVFNKGKLGGIPSIHFARWVLLPNRAVLFLSNFDNSWQSYLGDFIDRASSGLTSVWSNTVGYPRTVWLRRAGSRDAARFLAWTRHHQLPTQVWYSAYPALSIANVNANTEIRRGLAEPASIDAANWLFHLRSVDRQAVDELYSEQQAREPSLPRQDIQGIILWGYGHMKEARYLMFRIARAHEGLRPWLSALPLTSAGGESKVEGPPEPLINVAFTYSGLRSLGLDETACAGFPTPFVQGPHDPYRALVNGDVGDSAPERWRWGGPHNGVDVLLMVFANDAGSVAQYAQEFINQAGTVGLDLVQNLDGTTLPGRKEHFGFRDGIAQPIVRGSGRAEVQGNTIAAGEVLLGHEDGYGNVSHSPQTSAGFSFGNNGSYLVFRQLEQDVEGFWRACANAGHGSPAWVASKMVGRWPSGAPLVLHPNEDPKQDRFSNENDFRFLQPDENNDRYGARCPFGAHLRRANPRDWQLGETAEESLELSNLHRLLRRGRPYGVPLDQSMAVDAMVDKALNAAPDAQRESRGLHFLCFNANIERQFEFVQQQWMNNPNFAGLNAGPDPLVGMRRYDKEVGGAPAVFTQQTDVKQGLCPRSPQLQRFVRSVGSAYFFMPSIPAVRLLASALCEPNGGPALETIPPDERLSIDSLIDNLREKMKRDYVNGKMMRDAHPKMHGCVRATFEVHDGVDPSLRHGLFANARTFDAYVRFSNAQPSIGPDSRPDVRGMAIKVLNVDGAKLLEGDEMCRTHDFISVSHNAFVVRNVAEFDQLMSFFTRGPLSIGWYLLRHPRVALRVFLAFKRHASLTDITYHGVTPYLLGNIAIKHAISPSVPPAQTPMPERASYNFLREDLKRTLSKGSVSFDFMVQPQTDPRRMPIEDATVVWPASESPFRKVATLTLLKDDFDTPERQEFGDNLSFNPWRCLPEHRPLGGLNRARRIVYRALSNYRHERNAAAQNEPT